MQVISYFHICVTFLRSLPRILEANTCDDNYDCMIFGCLLNAKKLRLL